MGKKIREIKEEKSHSKILDTSTILSRKHKEKPTFYQIQRAGKGQPAIIITLETLFRLAETAGLSQGLQVWAFTIMPKSKNCPLKEVEHLSGYVSCESISSSETNRIQIGLTLNIITDIRDEKRRK